MANLSKRGVKTALRMRPILPGVSDSTPRHPKAYKELIERAAEAGAKAISYEVVFLPGMRTAVLNERWRKVEQIIGIPMRQLYKTFGKNQACIRPAYSWTEDIMHKIAEEARKNGMAVGISDPVWKELGDTGCCCGMLPDDPVFGNWQRESATNRLLEAKQTGREIRADDIIPAWAYLVKKTHLCNEGAGPLRVYEARRKLWADELRETWNTMDKERGPLLYFQGALWPVRKEGDEVIYKYRVLPRSADAGEVPYWNA